MSIGGTDVNSRLWNVMLASLVVQALTVGMAVAQSRPAVDVAFVHDREVSSWAQGQYTPGQSCRSTGRPVAKYPSIQLSVCRSRLARYPGAA